MKPVLALLLLLISGAAFAQERAVTDKGAVVLLNTDGTWRFESSDNNPSATTEVNPHSFAKDSSLSFAVKSDRNNAVFWIDPTRWSFKKSDASAASEYSFQLKGTDLYAMAITEAIPVDLDNLAALALKNAKNAGPDSHVIKKEMRTVNGQKVLYMETVGTIQGVHFAYLGYYFSNPAGTTQFLVYTGQSLVPKYSADIEKFLNGFSVQN